MSLARRRKIIALILSGFFVFSSFATVPLAAQAAVTTVLSDVQRTAGEFVLDIIGGVVRNALNAVLGKLAYDAAVFVSSGGKGQDSLVFSQEPAEYFKDVGDAAGGGVIEGFAEGTGLNAAGLCDPGSQFKVGLTVGLGDLIGDDSVIKDRQYHKPACTLTELGGNWQEAFDDPNFSEYVDLQFDTTANSMGISLEAQNTTLIAISEAQNEAEIERLKGDFKDKVSTVSKTVLTPSATIEHELEGATDASKRTFDTVGKPFTDAIGIFSTTLVSKLMQRLQDGLANLSNPGSLSSLIGGKSRVASGRAAAEARFAEIRQPIFAATGSFDILGELGSCPDQEEQQKVNNCAMGSRMALAITEGWTVQQFVDSLGGSDGFRFADDSLTSADIENGVTYRGIILMKKYRIVPVGWQLAAEYIRFENTDDQPSLQELIDDFDRCSSTDHSPFCGLIDPTWVFKAPQNFCVREAPGYDFAVDPQTLDTDGLTTTQDQVLYNRSNSCADSRGCIQEKEEGVCTAYGYCTEEDRIYRFAGQACAEEYSSCQTFVDSEGNDQSFVKSSVNYNDCATDPGCQWYCTSVNESGQYNCASPTETYISCSADVAANEADYGLPVDSLVYELNESCSCSTEKTCEVQAGSDLGYDAPPGDGVFDYWQCLVTNDDATTTLCELDNPCGAGNPNFDPDSGTCTCSIAETCFENSGDADCTTPNGNLCEIDENNDLAADVCSPDLDAYSSAPVCAPAGNDLYCGTCTVPYGQTNCTTEFGNEFTLPSADSPCAFTEGCPGTVNDTCSLPTGAFSCTSAAGNVCILGTQPEQPIVENDTIYFDSNIQFCDAGDAGCNKYIRVLPNTNLIPNAFFDYFDTEQNTLDDTNNDFVGFCTHDGGGCYTNDSCDEDLDGTPEGECLGWQQTDVSAQLLTGNFSGATSPELGDNYLRLSPESTPNGSLDTYVDTGRNLFNRTFTFAYKALSLQADTTTCNLTFAIGDANGNEIDTVTENDEPDENDLPIVSYTADWRDYFHTITFPDEDNYTTGVSGTTIKISIAENSACEIDIDGAMLLESDEFPGSYANYAEANVTQLNGDTLSCQPEDVGCELYVQNGRKDKDGVPGIITNPDSNACVGTCTSNPLLDEATCPIADWDNTAYNYSNPQCSQCTGNEDADQEPNHYEGCGFFQEVSLDTTAPITDEYGFLVPNSDDWNGIVKRYGGRCSDDNSTHCFNDGNCNVSVGASCDLQLSLIPKTGNQCALSQVGCEEYTNLDTVSQGGEGLEYYTQLKQCVKTDDPEIETYFTFEGSDIEGIQIVEHLLKKQQPGNNAPPCTSLNPESEDFNAECDDEDADNDGVLDSDCGPASDDDAYGIDSPNFDPDCRQYLNSAGDVFYRYESQVVEASDSCIPLRNSLDTRIYYGIPQQSNSCAAAANGCREYRGTDSANEREVINESFTLNSTENWVGATSTSNESLAELDYSLQMHDADTATTYNAAITYDLFTVAGTEVNGDLTPGTSYTLTFWAKTVDAGAAVFWIDGADTDYYFTTTGSATIASSGEVTLNPNQEGGWQYYQLGPVILDDQEDFDQNTVRFTMQFRGGAIDSEAFVDNIRLTESNSQYLIQDTFEYCQGFEGCRLYNDRDDNAHYLKSFVRLCGESVVGCELLLDTQNSTNPFTEAYNIDNEYDQDDVIVPADNATTLVYDEENECAESAIGCSEVGLPDVDERTGEIRSFTNTYTLDRPDDYISILCEQQQLQCTQYSSDFDGTVYFKDPGDRLCSLKQYTNEAGNLVNGWYKKGSLSDLPDCPLQHPQADPSQPLGGVCNSNSVSHEADGTINDNKIGKLCNQDADCFPSGWSNVDPLPRCISNLDDDVDVFDGQVHQFQTRDDDGVSLSATTSDFGWTGQCPGEQSGCSEYVDPSSPNISEINRNWSFEDDARTTSGTYYTGDTAPDGYPDWWYVYPNATFIDDPSGELDENEEVIQVPTEVDIEGDVNSGGDIEFDATCTEDSAIAIQTGSPAYSLSLGIVQPAEGDSAVELTNCILQNYWQLSIDPSKLYTVSAMVKLPNEASFGGNATPIEFSIGLTFKDADDNDLTEADGVTPQQVYVTADHITIPATAYEEDVDGKSKWYKIQGNIGVGSTVEFPANATLARVFVANHSATPMYFDAVSFKENDKYHYLDYTVDGTAEREQQDGTNSCFNQDADQSQITSDGGCVAFRDITFDTQNYSQEALDCASCLLTPNSDSCRSIIDACDTNTILQVKKDRTCSEWLGCETAEIVTSEDGVESVQCFEFGRCTELDLNGQCKSWQAKPSYGQLNASSDIHVTSAPGDTDSLEAIQNLTGYVKAGLTWTDTRQCADGNHVNESCTQNSDCFDKDENGIPTPADQPWVCAPPLQVEGYYPYGWMPEVGMNGASTGQDLIEFNDFENLYCAGEKGNSSTACILNKEFEGESENAAGHCYTRDLQTRVQTSRNSDNVLDVNDMVFSGPSTGFSTTDRDKAFCPNSDDFGEFWPFGGDEEGWQALGSSTMFVSQYDKRIDCTTDACENVDVNNVLQFSADQDSASAFGGGVEYRIEDGVSPNGSYALSFDARFATSPTYAGEDVVNPTAVTVCLNHAGIFNASGNELERKDCFVEGFGQADIIFAIDTSGSMGTPINAVKTAAPALATELANAGISARFALIDMDYIDLDQDGSGYSNIDDRVKENFNDIDLDFTDNITTFTNAVNSMGAAGARVDGFNAIYESALNQFTQGGPDWPTPETEIYEEDALTNREGANRFLILVTDEDDELEGSGRATNHVGSIEAEEAVQQVDMPVYLLTDNDTLNGCSEGSHGIPYTPESNCIARGGTWEPQYGIYASVIAASNGAQYSYQNSNPIDNWVTGTTIVNDLFNNILQHVTVFQFSEQMQRYTLGPIQATQRSLEDPEVNAAASQDITTDLEFTVSDSTQVQIDNVSMLPVLETNKDLPAISRTCRAYPEGTARQCDYTQPNGTKFRGWKGYCLEADPIQPQRCITWFPLDVLAGEEALVPRTPSGYQGRSGVFYCAISKGLQNPGFCDWDPAAPLDTSFVGTPGDFGEAAVCVNDAMCGNGSGPCRVGTNYQVGGDPDNYAGDPFGNLYVQSEQPTSTRGEYGIEPMRWQVRDPFESHPTEHHTFGVGNITRIPANDVLRNIHISEMESLIFNTGSAGAMADGATVEWPYWGQLGNWDSDTESQANFDPIPAWPTIAPADTKNCNSDPANFNCDDYGNWNLFDFSLDTGGSIRRENGTYMPWENCGSYNENQGPEATAGFGCRVWGLYDSEFLPDYYENNNEAQLQQADHGLDMVYTWVWSNFDWGFDEAAAGDNPGADKNCTISGSDNHAYTYLDQNRADMFSSECMSPNVQAVMGVDNSGNLTSNSSRNPWEHLAPIANGTPIFSSDPECGTPSHPACGIYQPEVTNEVIETIPFTKEDLQSWPGWAELGDKYMERAAGQSSQYGGNIFSLYVDVNDEGYIQAIYTLVYFGAPGTYDGPMTNIAPLIPIAIAAAVPEYIPLINVAVNNAITGNGNDNLSSLPAILPLPLPVLPYPYFYPTAADGVDLTAENDMSLKVQLRESCALIGEAVDQGGGNTAWSSRANTGGYNIHTSETNDDTLEYGVEANTPPYGSISILDNEPDRSDWDALLKSDSNNTFTGNTYGPQPIYAYTANPDSVSAGRPLSCLGDCDTKYCVGDAATQGDECEGNGQCGDGVCMGVGDPLISRDAADNQPYGDIQGQIEGTVLQAQNRLKHIFANMVNFYQLDYSVPFTSTGGDIATTMYSAVGDMQVPPNNPVPIGLNYWANFPSSPNPLVDDDSSDNISNIFTAMQACDSDGNGTPDGGPRDSNAEGQDPEYCGVYPTVDSITIDGNATLADTRYDITNGKTVKLKFTSNVDVNQTALKYVYIDWGDGITTFERWNAAPTQHVFTHAYNCDPNSQSYEETDYTTIPWANQNTLTADCDFLPKITVVDNWNWCSGGIETAAASGQLHRYLETNGENAKYSCGSYDIPNFLITVDEAS